MQNMVAKQSLQTAILIIPAYIHKHGIKPSDPTSSEGRKKNWKID
jgi:hypothetical protein